MGRTDTDTSQSPDSSDLAQRPPLVFPRLVLPPVPTFRRGDEMTPHVDEPVGTWQPPFPPPLAAEDRYRAMVERVAAFAGPQALAAPTVVDVVDGHAATDAPNPFAVPPMPELQTEPTVVAARSSMVAVGLVVLVAAFLAWASRMAFSPALLALSGLLLAQLAATASASSPRGGRRALVAGASAVVLSLLAVKGAIHGFSDMAFVAGLFVIAAAVPTLLLLGVAQLVLHRRGERASASDAVLRAGWKLRFGALLVTLLAGVQAHRSFSAVPDAIVTFGIVALVVVVWLQALHRRAEDDAPG